MPQAPGAQEIEGMIQKRKVEALGLETQIGVMQKLGTDDEAADLIEKCREIYHLMTRLENLRHNETCGWVKEKLDALDSLEKD